MEGQRAAGSVRFERRLYKASIISVCLLGMILRLACCFWAYPAQFHPDEDAIVANTIDMLQRHSWQAYLYSWPGQLPIKLNALLFSLFSHIKYHQAAYEAFPDHIEVFYLLARGLTVLFGMGIVIITGMVLQTITAKWESGNREAVFTGCVLAALSPVYIKHSALSTPDVTLTFFVVLFTFGLMQYIEKGEFRYFLLCVIALGLGFTTKYPALFLSPVLAIAVIIKEGISKKKYGKIFIYAVISIGLIAVITFLVFPNFFLHLPDVLNGVFAEADFTSLGIHSLGFLGNVKYYSLEALADPGYIASIPFILGLITLMIRKERINWALFSGVLYLACISLISIHWRRWGIPVFIFFLWAIALGTSSGLSLLRSGTVVRKLAGFLVCLSSIILLLNTILTAFAQTKYRLLPDIRYLSLSYLKEHDITPANTISESYTPYAPNGYGVDAEDAFVIENGKPTLLPEYADISYFIRNESMAKSYRDERENYPRQAALYDAIEEEFSLIYSQESDGEFVQIPYAMKNIQYSIDYLMKQYHSTGSAFYVYEIK